MEGGKGQVCCCPTYGQLIECHTQREWNDNFNRGKESKKLVVAFFTSTCSNDCISITPVVAQYAGEYPRVMFLKVDVDELKNVADTYQVSKVPTFIFFKEGATVEIYVGRDTTALKQLIKSNGDVCGSAATVSA
ncbi:hypothetical protein ACH5RR_027406 [Cinchona calisaya]|uniref:Thioredoxin domain-containing protein n=1 Tax=Cinchona calisaya TaxID=153742 RepID=A0ABD2Z759_9GENT